MRAEDEMRRIYQHDMKHYKAQDKSMLVKSISWLVCILVIAAIAYVSEADYQECLAGNQSVVLCGGGNTK